MWMSPWRFSLLLSLHEERQLFKSEALHYAPSFKQFSYAIYPSQGHEEVLEPIAAAYGRRQGAPLGEWPAHPRALCERWRVRYLAQGYL